MYIPVQREETVPYIPPATLTIQGYISSIRVNHVLVQLTLELDITGSRFEYFSRRELTVKRFISWYGDNRGMVYVGTRVCITVDSTLEVIGFQ